LSTTSNSRLLLFAASLAVVLHVSPAAVGLVKGSELQPYEAVEAHMGTLFRIKLYAGSPEQAQAGFRAAYARVGQLDDILSDYKPDSELSRLSRAPAGIPFAVSADLFHVVEAAQHLAGQTDGAFDITLGPVIRLWREARKTGRLPDTAALEMAGRLCGYRKLELDAGRHTIKLEQNGMQLDVGGIAKGYAADEALRALSSLGIRSALVAASGDLAFSNPPPGKSGWTIGIDSFDQADAPFAKVLDLANAAVSTSGDAEQHLDANKKRYSHIIDPKTDIGLTEPLTVTVVASKGIDADSLATALSVMGEKRGMAFIETQAGSAALMVLGKNGAHHVIESRAFQRLPANATFGEN
jgi:thiamine biosynthesis lipoprotein